MDDKKFERWYVENAFDYASSPIGSRDCGLMRKAWHAALAAADAEAVPVAEVSGSVPPTRSAMVFPLGDVCLLQGMKLYDRPQPADVCVLVEALRKIADGAHAAGDIAQQALAEREAKR